MQFERLRKSHKKQIIIGALSVCLIGGILTFATSRAFYRVDENIDLAKGTINYKAYDFKIMAMYKSDDKTNYTEIEEMPSEGYTINEIKSYCNMSNGNKDATAILKTIDGNHIISKLKKNDRCFIYFDKEMTASETILANLGTSIKTTTPDFSQTATTDEGVFITDDPMYGTNAKTYYWRGAATTNYLKFANFCWRIIRINGDGSLRLIYDGSICHQNGESTTNNIALSKTSYNKLYNNNSYVGWTYTTGSQRPIDNLNGTSSNAKVQIESWYDSNIGNNSTYISKVIDGKFCNDRSTKNNEAWRATGEDQYYAASARLLENNYTPTLNCLLRDTYTLKIGLITADEIQYAGGSGTRGNNNYYLYNGNYYWTMTPYYWFSNGYAEMFVIDYSSGGLRAYHVLGDSTCPGLRPVINLKSDITFSDGDGTLNNPYIVAN